jgi:hypothetical protein
MSGFFNNLFLASCGCNGFQNSIGHVKVDMSIKCQTALKGASDEVFDFKFFHESVSIGPLKGFEIVR